MRNLLIAAASLGLVGQAVAAPVPVARMPAHKAFDSVPQAAGQACMDGGRLLSHTAYTLSGGHPLRCSELLSTDTLMKVHHWDKT